MRMKVLGVVLLVALLSLVGCRTYPDYSSDFRFPILSGDIQKGQQAFVDLECHQCHVVEGVEVPDYDGTRLFAMSLGGDIVFAKTYGDLVTSIINPDHVISDQYLDLLPEAAQRRASSSPMYLKEEMTVVQLIDIVAFLNSRYSLLPGYTEYYY